MQLNLWSKQNHLPLNLNKTKEIVFRSHTHQHPTIIDNTVIETVDHFKYLGLIIDNKFSFDQHTQNI